MRKLKEAAEKVSAETEFKNESRETVILINTFHVYSDEVDAPTQFGQQISRLSDGGNSGLD